jgi:hypothetical protein
MLQKLKSCTGGSCGPGQPRQKYERPDPFRKIWAWCVPVTPAIEKSINRIMSQAVPWQKK